jgi:hypothetical protein
MKEIHKFGSGVRVIDPTKREMDYISQVYNVILDWCLQQDGSYVLYGLFSKADAVVNEFSRKTGEAISCCS